MKEYIVLTRLGKMAFEVDRDQIVKLSFTDRPQTSALFPVCVNMAVKEIDQYLNREITVFSIPYRLNARGFQLQVLRALLEIGYGQLITYKELAIKTGFPRHGEPPLWLKSIILWLITMPPCRSQRRNDRWVCRRDGNQTSIN